MRSCGIVITLLVVYYSHHLLQRWRRRQIIRSQHRFESAPKYPHRDPFFGIDLLREHTDRIKKNKALESWTQRFQKHGSTFTGIAQFRNATFTVDEKNLQALQSTEFSSFGVQPLRRDACLPFLGEGVFTMDGLFWEHSRALLRPTFLKKNVANLKSIESKFELFLKLLPKDGTTVDLKPLVHRLVC